MKAGLYEMWKRGFRDRMSWDYFYRVARPFEGKKEMKTIISGSREIFDYNEVLNTIQEIDFRILEIVSGCACGVDQLGERYANEMGIPLVKFPADWNKYGNYAGYKRNKEMAEYADALIAIWDGKSKGTKNMIDIATEKGLKVHVHSKSGGGNVKMAFEEVTGNPVWRFEKEGDSVEGEYVGESEGQYGKDYLIKCDSGETFTVFGKTVLRTKMKSVAQGKKVKITYLGEVKAKKGNTLYQDYKVEVDRG